MFVGRKEELFRLEEYYRQEKSGVYVLYGREGIGKTTLFEEFSKEKPFIRYCAQDCTNALQARLFCQNLGADETKDICELIFETFQAMPSGKKLLFIDEFQNIADKGPEFAGLLVKLLTLSGQGDSENRMMILLASSSVNWIENAMVESLGSTARLIAGYLKLSELSFSDMVQMLGKTSVSDCIVAKAGLGGVPGYLELWRENASLKGNICTLFLAKHSALKHEAEHLLRREFRELSTYNLILYSLATGNRKLNDLYNATGFSRAKISVYLKNLIQLDYVEKIFSYDESGHDNMQKGLYRIKDSFLAFYYAFVFPNLSAIEQGKGSEIFDTRIAPSLEEYLRPYFADVCKEFLTLMSEYGRLFYKFTDFREWHGKKGTIDIVAADEKGNCLVAGCTYKPGKSDANDYEKLMELAEQAGVKPKQVFLFARGGFNSELQAVSKESKGYLNLIALSDL